MIYPPGATSISVDVLWLDDYGAAVLGKVASDFPVVKWSSGSNSADTTIAITDLAAITTAHPNDNTAGGVKEREGGFYRLDLPNNMLTSAGIKRLTFAETTNKRIIAPVIEVQYVQSDDRQLLGTAYATPATAGVPTVDTKYVTGTLQTTKDLGALNVTNVNTLAGHDPGATIGTGTSTLTQSQVTGGAFALNSSSFAFNAALDFTTTQKAATIARVTLTDTTTTLTNGITVSDKTGFKLASDGLDSVAITAPSGVASNFREMIVQVWRRFFKKSTLTSTQLKTYADDGTTLVTTQTVSDDGTTQTQGTSS